MCVPSQGPTSSVSEDGYLRASESPKGTALKKHLGFVKEKTNIESDLGSMPKICLVGSVVYSLSGLLHHSVAGGGQNYYVSMRIKVILCCFCACLCTYVCKHVCVLKAGQPLCASVSSWLNGRPTLCDQTFRGSPTPTCVPFLCILLVPQGLCQVSSWLSLQTALSNAWRHNSLAGYSATGMSVSPRCDTLCGKQVTWGRLKLQTSDHHGLWSTPRFWAV